MKGLQLTDDISQLKFGDRVKYYEKDYESAVYFVSAIDKDKNCVQFQNLDDADDIWVYAEELHKWYRWEDTNQ